MATGFRITLHSLADGMVVMDEPFALWQDIEGEAYVVCAAPVEVAADPTKATEHIGSVPSPDQLSG